MIAHLRSHLVSSRSIGWIFSAFAAGAACVPDGNASSDPSFDAPVCSGCADPPRGVIDGALASLGPFAPPAPRGVVSILAGAGQDLVVVRDHDGAVVARRTLDVDDGSGPWPLASVAVSGAGYFALVRSPVDEGGVLFRGSITSDGIGVEPSGWSAAPIGLGAVGRDVVLFENAPGDRWRLLGRTSSLACPVPGWVHAAPVADGMRVDAWSADGANAIGVVVDDDGLASCTDEGAPSLPLVPGDRVVAVAGPAAGPVAVVEASGGLSVIDAAGRARIPGSHLAGITVSPTPFGRATFLLLGEESGASVVVARLAHHTFSIPLAGEVAPELVLDRLVPVADGVAVGIEGALVRVVLTAGGLGIRYRVALPGDAHLAPVLVSAAPRDEDRGRGSTSAR